LKVILNAAGYVGQSGGAGGAGVFIQYLCRELSRLHAVDVLISPNSRSFQGHHRSARSIELPYVTAETLRHLREGPTVVIDPFGALPCAPFPEDIALCTVVHDLMHLERPEFFTEAERRGRSESFARGLGRADAVVTFSADQARAVRRYFPGANPVVIPHLPYAALGDPVLTESEADTSTYEPFVLFPAVRWPHKNHRTVLAAFAAYIRSTGSKLRLVLCGGPCAETRFSFFPPNESISDQVIDLGLISDAKVLALFRAASAVIFPTLYEGFGIPVLEASYLGKMVVATRLDVFDEILGPQGYRAVSDPLCQLRWMRAFADVETSQRGEYEAATQSVKKKVTEAKFIRDFSDTLKSIAERYTHPAVYRTRSFPTGDRPTSSIVAELSFTDIFGTATVERGARIVTLGAKSTTQASWIFRGAKTEEDRRVCLRGHFTVDDKYANTGGSLYFHSWIRLLGESKLDAFLWSVNDGRVVDLLPDLRDNEWHLVRLSIPSGGFIDLRASRGGVSELAIADIELHDACIVRVDMMPIPQSEPADKSLEIIVAAFAEATTLESTVAAARNVDEALQLGELRLQWNIVTTLGAADSCPAMDLPSNVRIQIVGPNSYTRTDASGLLSPYHRVDQLLLLEANDIPRCLENGNLEMIRAALGVAPRRTRTLSIDREAVGLWSQNEHGRIFKAGHRAGQPIPFLDSEVIQKCLTVKVVDSRPRFAVIETDLTGNISHHSVVTGLFLEGAEQCGFQPMLGLNHLAKSSTDDNFVFWMGFGTQVYLPGSADKFTDELTEFVRIHKLGANDVIFMHSLSPQIVLGTARFVASHPATSPRFAMRFFSTSEAMRGHKLSYTKILKSIESVEIVRRKMHFFCESENLVSYYEKAIGRRYPLLLNPEHPSLTLVRNSHWLDPGLGGGQHPLLAYFGEARAEKGFDEIPGILEDLLANPTMAAFHFMIQSGSNRNNQTPAMAKAKTALDALRKSHPQRIRIFESVETPEQFYFLMKHVRGVIAPYRTDAYRIRGTGVTLEALQMGLDVFAWADTDLYATFHHTGRLIGVAKGQTFAQVIAQHYTNAPTEPKPDLTALRKSPAEVCERLLALCFPAAAPKTSPVLWVGNDVFGEGNSFVYSAQKRALKAIGRDCFELFVPWPDRNWRGVQEGAYDERIYGFDSEYTCTGLGWVARPEFNPELDAVLDSIEETGPTYARLRDLNRHMHMPESLRCAIEATQVTQTVLNYAHLYPAIAGLVPQDKVVCETHDIMTYAHAVRRNGPISLTEKIDEFSSLGQFAQIIAISVEEQREIQSACPTSQVFWRMPPYVPEPPRDLRAFLPFPAETDPGDLAVPEVVARPTPTMLSVYYTRPDLQRAYELHTSRGRMAYFSWWLFIGHRETGRGFDFTPEQQQWLVGTIGGEGVQTKLTGLLQLLIVFRPDLRAAFTSGDAVNVAKLSAWGERRGALELGFWREDLISKTKPNIGQNRAAVTQNMCALDAILDAAPTEIKGSVSEVEALFQRVAEIGAIDLVLVGSSHPANIKSFRWFIDDVFLPYIAPSGRNLFIIGTVCRQLENSMHRSIVLVGRCERIEPLLRAARACPLPVIAGSGSPIKTIPALAVNGAVTITDRIERAFGLSDYGIPSFSDPKAYAEDVLALLANEDLREQRIKNAGNYVNDVLKQEGYVEFWRQRLI
jgi:glycosyltransferase involved in cell wall biosynthesis